MTNGPLTPVSKLFKIHIQNSQMRRRLKESIALAKEEGRDSIPVSEIQYAMNGMSDRTSPEEIREALSSLRENQ